jgi:ABC-type polysaccharide/polyol phosphate export permease
MGSELRIYTAGHSSLSGLARLRLHLQELFHYRELVRQLVLRDLKARYKNSILGFLWSLLNPLGTMIVFTVVFNVLLKQWNFPDYPVFLLSALLPWNFLVGALTSGTASVLANAPLVRKVYFPREVLPIAAVLAHGVNFWLSLVPLFALAAAMGRPFTPWIIVFLPVLFLLEVALALGLSFFLCALNVFYRDVQMILEVATLAWFFATPIFWPIHVLENRWVTILGVRFNTWVWLNRLNPMASLAAAYRDILYWGVPVGLDFLARTAVTCLAILAVGYWFFLRLSPRFGEEL